MAATRRMTRQVQIGLSHSEKAKKLSYNGFYEEALKELNIALRAFESENREGAWDDAIAGVLNNAGFVYLFLGKYQNSEDTFKSALAIKGRLGDQRSLAATLVGLADAYKGLCQFDESASALEDALDIALALKANSLAQTLMASMDTLERTRCDMPDGNTSDVDFDELYMPPEAADITARISNVSIGILRPGEIEVEVDIGFPYQMKDLVGIERSDSQPFPCIALLFPKGVESKLKRSVVTDEEETVVGSAASSFDGIIYGPGSYHRCGPQPMPSCKQYVYTHGAGHVLGWDVAANGWYHVEATLEVKNLPEILRLTIAIPFGNVKIASVSLGADEPGEWVKARAGAGSFLKNRTLDTSTSAFSVEKMLYEGPLNSASQINKSLSLKFGMLYLDLYK